MEIPQWTSAEQNVTFAPKQPPRAFDDSWRGWIAENLVLGCPPVDLVSALIENGFAVSESQKEVDLACSSPYLRSGDILTKRLAKHDWVLEIHRKLARMLPGWNKVERRHKLTREEFLHGYYALNRPVVITGMMDDWPALANWTPAYLKAHYGERTVEVQANRNANKRYEIEGPNHKRQMLFGDFIDFIVSSGETNDAYMTANNTGHNAEVLRDLWNDVVQIPEYLDSTSSQRGFFWFGPAGTITPLHHDLTNNFMAQVYGRKLVKLVQATELPYVYNNLHCYSEVDVGNIDYERFPLMRNVNVIDCELGPGDILFLPVGCWHYVRGLEISITMSFTNFVFDNDFASMYTTYNAV